MKFFSSNVITLNYLGKPDNLTRACSVFPLTHFVRKCYALTAHVRGCSSSRRNLEFEQINHAAKVLWPLRNEEGCGGAKKLRAINERAYGLRRQCRRRYCNLYACVTLRHFYQSRSGAGSLSLTPKKIRYDYTNWNCCLFRLRRLAVKVSIWVENEPPSIWAKVIFKVS